ncbi:MAG: Na+/H+ antiporter NhaC family protein, partial [Slackia sp.]|nr:Na+/H+ antiporter NhaC family protein [Slackia sp.]
MLEKRETGQAESAAATAAVEEARLQDSGGEAIGPNGFALLPIIVFLVLYLGSGVYFEYVRPIDGQMGFYVISVVVAFMVALTVALVQNRSLSFDEKIRHCARGIGDENIVIMLFIFLFAGVFSGLASAAGGAESTANMMLSVIPSSFAIPGLFLIAAIISLAMGTSTGTVSVLAPIAVAVSANADLNLAFCVASVIGGAMFGDNLSFISDTTIASTKTQGAAMKDKFYENAKIAIPVALVSMVVIAVVASSSAPASVGTYEFNPVLTVPYFVVLILAMTGMNVLLVLTIGILLMLLTGVAAGTLSFVSAFTSMGTGATGMFETMIVTILV